MAQGYSCQGGPGITVDQDEEKHRSLMTGKRKMESRLHGVPVIKVLSYCLSGPSPLFFTLSCDTAFGTLQATFGLPAPSLLGSSNRACRRPKAEREKRDLLFLICF